MHEEIVLRRAILVFLRLAHIYIVADVTGPAWRFFNFRARQRDLYSFTISYDRKKKLHCARARGVDARPFFCERIKIEAFDVQNELFAAIFLFYSVKNASKTNFFYIP